MSQNGSGVQHNPLLTIGQPVLALPVLFWRDRPDTLAL
jgi:hypothetical protein